jgi:hypothetical protein
MSLKGNETKLNAPDSTRSIALMQIPYWIHLWCYPRTARRMILSALCLSITTWLPLKADLVEPTAATKLTHLLPDTVTDTGPQGSPVCKKTTTQKYRCQSAQETDRCRAAMAQGEPGAPAWPGPYGDQYDSVSEVTGSRQTFTASSSTGYNIGVSFLGGLVTASVQNGTTYTITYEKCVYP